MLAIDRQRRIQNLLQELGSLRTTETAHLLGVTDETVRKDFEILEKQGKLTRTHGGACRRDGPRGEAPFMERQAVRRDEKQAIARIAAARIQANETLFLDASSTALTLTEFLPELPLTIVTNALNVFTALSERPGLDLICTGGLYDAASRSFIGLTAEKALQRYHIHRMFFSGSGVDRQRGASESNARQAAFKERVIALSEDVVLLADHSKLGARSSFFFADMGSFNCLVTDRQADPVWLEEMTRRGVEVLQAP